MSSLVEVCRVYFKKNIKLSSLNSEMFEAARVLITCGDLKDKSDVLEVIHDNYLSCEMLTKNERTLLALAFSVPDNTSVVRLLNDPSRGGVILHTFEKGGREWYKIGRTNGEMHSWPVEQCIEL